MEQLQETKHPAASVSLDLDNLWSYMKIHGDSAWETYPSYLEVFIPPALDLLDNLNLKITFFIVGQDAALDQNKDILKLIVARGHEIGNHSFHHEPWIHLYTKDRITNEILKAEEHIFQATGQKPIGFRGPGFCWSSDLFSALTENGYVYDASSFPSFIGPLARMFYFGNSNFSKEERSQRKNLFGSFKDGLRPVKPHMWDLSAGKELLEIPVSTLPIFKIPFHLTYLLYLSRFSLKLMSFYLQTSIVLCKSMKISLSFLLHPLDLIGADKVSELAFFPGMDIPTERKLFIFNKVMAILSMHFHLVNMSTHAKLILQNRERLRIRKLSSDNHNS